MLHDSLPLPVMNYRIVTKSILPIIVLFTSKVFCVKE